MTDTRDVISFLESPNSPTELGVEFNKQSNATIQNTRTQSLVALNTRVNIETVMPEGTASNYSIHTALSTGSITVTLRGFLGDASPTPLQLSSTNLSTEIPPVTGNYINARFSNSILTVAPTGISLDATTGWFNLNASYLQDKKHDLFVYLINNTGGVRLGLSRASHYKVVSEADTTTATNDKYLAVSGTVASADKMINIGRITVEMDTTGAFTYADDVVNKPILESEKREIDYDVVLGGFSGSVTGSYKIVGNFCYIRYSYFPDIGGNTGTVIVVNNLPFLNIDGPEVFQTSGGCDIATNGDIRGGAYRRGSDASINIRKYDSGSMGGGITGTQYTTMYEI